MGGISEGPGPQGTDRPSPEGPFVETSAGYPWRVAPQQSPLPFHRLL